MNGPKLLFFVTEDWYFCSHRLPIARAAFQNGLDIVIVTRVNTHGQFIKNEGFKLIPLNINRSGKNPFYDIFTFFSLIKIYKKEKPDIVHHVSLKPVLYGSWAARLTGVPHIVNALAGLGHVFIDKGFKAFLLKKIVKLAFKLALSPKNVRVILQNPDDLNLFIREHILTKKQITLVKGSGVDTKIFYPETKKPEIPIVVLVARMLWSKGAGDFFQAAKILREKEVPVRMVLVGEPDPINPASVPVERLKSWSSSSIIEWWERREDIPDILKQSTIAVLPSSYGEGVPKSLIEAASVGLPIVTYDVPGCREIVRNRENGFLVPLNDIKGLVCAIEKLLKNAALRQKMGKKSREIVINEFSEEIVVKQTMDLYKNLLRNNGFGSSKRYNSEC